MRRFILAALIILAGAAEAAFGQGILVSSSIPGNPTAITCNGLAPPGTATIVENAGSGTVVCTLGESGGLAPFTYTDTDNTKFAISGSELQRSGTGSLTAGVSESVNIRVTDANGHSFTTASAFSISVSPAGSGTFIEQITIPNNSGATQATNFVTPMFGLGFKKADIPSGQYPSLALADGTVVSCSFGKYPATWSDGSLKFLPAMCRVPTTVAGSGSITLNVFNGGSAPSASSRALSDFAASSTDLNVTVVGLDNLSGTWVSDLNQGIAAHGADYQWLDGPAGSCWRVRASFRQSSADEGQLEGWWYVCALQNAAGGLGGLRYDVAITKPYYDAANVYASFSSIQILNGASLVADMWSAHGAGRTFTYSGASNIFNATAHGMESGWAARLTTTGTLPAPLATGTTYFVADPGSVGVNKFKLGTDSSTVVTGTAITITDSGTGTHTVTPYPYVVPFESLQLANTDGTWRFIQGGGSFTADNTVRVAQNNIYLRSSGLIPPYAFETYSGIASSAAQTWFPMTAGSVTRDFEGTGERCDIGPETCWSARYWFTQSAVDEQVVRVIAMIGQQLPMNLRSSVTHTLPVLNNTTYAGMPAANSSFFWNASKGSTQSGLTTPSNNSVWKPGFQSWNSSHLPDWCYVAYLITAEPDKADCLANDASAAISDRTAVFGTAVASSSGTTNIGGTAGAQRNGSINGTSYYGWQANSGNLERENAWGIRIVSAAAGILPDTNPEGASYHTYFTDLNKAAFDADNAFVTMLQSCCSFAYGAGIWSEANTGYGGVSVSWAEGYMRNAASLAYARTEYAGALTFLNYRNKWPKHVHDNFGVSWMPYYHAIIRQSSNARTAPYALSDAGIAFTGQGFDISWSSATGLFTLTNKPIGYTLTVGDKFIFNDQNGGTKPAGFSGETPYYVVAPVVGSTGKLSATPGGTAIAFTDSGTNTGGEVAGYSVSLVSPYLNALPNSGNSYPQNYYSGLCNSASVGATMDATTLSDLAALIHAQAGYVAAYQANPEYAYQCTQ
jgi:hypothetical protein